MSSFYDGQAARISGRLDLGGGYDLPYEESGAADGVPVLYLHGGPGAGMDRNARRFHDPAHYRLIMFDQRGTGDARPSGSIEHNTTSLLIDDIERLRSALGVDRWVVSGGSWGSTLTLAYAEAHPERCRAVVTRGVFLGTRAEMDWVYQGMRVLFPLEWQRCVEGLCASEQQRLHATFLPRLVGNDRQAAVAVALKLCRFEWLCSGMTVDESAVDAELTPEFALAYARILCHYEVNDFFLEPDQLVRNVGRIRHLPGFIVQGKCDWVCPPWSAVRLHQAWPGSKLALLPLTGHLISEPAIAAELLRVMEELKSGAGRKAGP